MQVAITVNKPFKLNLLKHKYAAEAVSTTEVEVKRNQNSFISLGKVVSVYDAYTTSECLYKTNIIYYTYIIMCLVLHSF